MGGRIIESHKAKNSNSLLQVGTSPKLELFPTSTYCVVSSSGTTTNLRTKERGGFPVGADLYVGTRASAVTIQSGNGTGQGTIVINVSIAYSQYDTISLKDTGGSTLYANAYAEPNLSTTTSFPITLDGDNETRFFIAPGMYGRRIQDSSGNILEHDHDVSYGSDGIWVTPGHNSDTAGIQEAANKLPVGGSVVNIGPGTYVISDGVYLPIGTTLRGVGRDNVILRAAPSASGNFANQINSTAGFMVGADAVSTNAAVTSITVEGITFDGNRSNFTGTLQMCHIWRTNRAVIRNCRFRDLSTAAAANARAILVDTRSTAPETDIDIYFNDFIQIGDDTSNASNGILIASPVDRVRISHNTFDNTAVEARANFITVGETFGTGQTEAIIIGNEIHNFETGTALGDVGARGISVNYFSNVIISGNLIDATEGDMINVEDSHTVTISDNIVKRGRGDGIGIAGCKNVAINGNITNESDGAGIVCQVTLSGLTSFTGAANVTINGNVVLDNDQDGALGGIVLRSATSDLTAGANFVITSNVCGDTRSAGDRQEYGISIVNASGNDPTWRNGLIANNHIYNADADGIRVNDVATCQITDNVVLDCDVFGINVESSTNVIVEGNRVAGSGTQDIKFQGTTTGSKLRFNSLPSGLRTAMSGFTQMANSNNGAVATIPATGANPYIREDCVISVGYSSKSTGRTMMQPTIATCQNGSITMFARGHTSAGHATFPGGTTTVYWTFIEGTTTA